MLLVGCGNGRHYFYLGRKVVGTMNYNNFGVSRHEMAEKHEMETCFEEVCSVKRNG